MKLIIAIWFAVTLILFGAFATRGTYGLFGTGANSWTVYGWPGGWLSRNQYQTFSTNEDGEIIQTEYWVKWYVSDWAMLSTAVATSAAVPALFLTPFVLSKRKASKTRSASGIILKLNQSKDNYQANRTLILRVRLPRRWGIE